MNEMIVKEEDICWTHQRWERQYSLNREKRWLMWLEIIKNSITKCFQEILNK